MSAWRSRSLLKKVVRRPGDGRGVFGPPCLGFGFPPLPIRLGGGGQGVPPLLGGGDGERDADAGRRQQDQGDRPPPSRAPRGASTRTSAACSRPTAGRPPPARPPGSAGRPRPARWPSRTAGCGPSPAPSSRSSRARRGPACVSFAGSICRRARRGVGSASRRAQPGARPRRLLLPDQPAHLVPRRLLEPLPLQRRRAGQQLVEDHAQE